MAPRRKVRAREAQLAFEALTIEGGVLSSEWLSKVAQLQASNQSEADYRIPKGLALRDEIGRYWRIAQAHWSDFRAGREKQAEATALSERFVLGLLRECFGFGSLTEAEPVALGGRTYPVGHGALDGRVPVVIAPAGSGIDALSPIFGEDGRRRSAFGLAQEFLNADDRALWGLATDGLTLRLCRDNASLTRPAWIEADLGRIFSEERYADFAALWLLIHESRFGAVGHAVTDCPLEAWRVSGREEGTRAREKLREGVEDALVALGRGFLTHADNQALRTALHGGQLTRDAYFQQLLRLVYRVIFLLTAEERGVLHPPDTAEVAKDLYGKGYSLRRLRDRSAKRSAHDRFGDLWEGLKIAFRGVATGEPRLALPALGGLFAKAQCPALDGAKLENRWLMMAIFKLAWVREESGLARVNWRDMGPEELGSVYESLLELVPLIPQDGRGFSFASGDETKGNARKTTGSYYTPDGLVQVLLGSALEPVIQTTVAAHPEDPAAALLKLAVVDPACGSGHFLLAAARRLAVHVARHQAKGTPSAEQYRHAVRQVVSRCLFGIDLNPMAVELCRVSLWMEAVEPGRPLSFLDSHIQRGNALLGATPDLMKQGVPDAAFEPIEGDDKKTASLLKKRNREVAEKQGLFDTLWSKEARIETDQVARAVAELDAAPDADLAAVVGKETRWDELQASDAFRHQRFVADAWCAAFVWPKPEIESAGGGKQKKASPIVEAAPTNALWLQIQSKQGIAPALTARTIGELAAHHQFFHWHLAFPQVFARGGFDVVLGNPPWERVKLQEKEWFASTVPEIATATNTSARRRLIEDLATSNPGLYASFLKEVRRAAGESHFLRNSGAFALTSAGDVNLYAVFAERMRTALTHSGRLGCVVPTGVATDDTTKLFFQDLVSTRSLVSLFDFENHGLFADVDSRYKFCLVCAGSGIRPIAEAAEFVFFARSVEDLYRAERRFELTESDVRLLNPVTRTCPVMMFRRDADLLKAIHQRMPALCDQQAPGDWCLDIFQKMIDATIHADLCSFTAEPPAPGWLPVYEGRSLRHYNHRATTYRGVSDSDRQNGKPRESALAELNDPTFTFWPAYWVSPTTFSERLGTRPFRYNWFPSLRYVARSTDERTVIPGIRPYVPSNNKLTSLALAPDGRDQACFVGILSSFILDYVARQKVGGTTLGGYIVEQMPVPSVAQLASPCAWDASSPVREWLCMRVLELTYSAWDLGSFANDVGYEGPPFRWDPVRRFLLRAELDAAFFHLYGISRDDTNYILDTFPIVRKNDEKVYEEYRTKRVILEVYDAMVEATRTGKPYQTRLDPPPADPRVAHPPRRRA